jgi:hypothetical protein
VPSNALYGFTGAAEMTTVLVTGGRDYADMATVYETLTMPSVSYEPSDNYLGFELAVETDEGTILLNSTSAIPP